MSKVAEPAALGLFGLAIVTLVVGAHQLNYLPNLYVVAAFAFIMGGAVQIVAGIMDFKRENIFGATAFSSYGFFWVSVVFTWLLLYKGAITAVDYAQLLGWFSIGWLIFTAYMTYGAAYINKALFVIFLLIDVVFLTLIGHAFFGLDIMYPGVAHLLLSAASFYGSAGIVLNTQLGKTVLNLGKPVKK